jgi:hypothetical protein
MIQMPLNLKARDILATYPRNKNLQLSETQLCLSYILFIKCVFCSNTVASNDRQT